MALIKPEDINNLHTAEELCEVADNAAKDHELSAVIRLCNLAANTGEHSAIWDKSLSKDTKAILEQKGYKVIQSKNSADPRYLWEISWRVKH